jgi:GTP-binding protein
LGILIEKMRREGFEMACTPPIVITKKDEKTGKTLEPIEKVTIEVNSKYSPGIIDKLTNRGAVYESANEVNSEV